MLNIIGNRKIYFIFSSIIIGLSLLALATWGLKLSIDFTGGAVSEMSFGVRPDKAALEDTLRDMDLGNKVITSSGNNEFIIKTKTLDEETHQKMVSVVTTKFSDAKELKFDSIGPVIGTELKTKAIWALLTGMLGIGLYVTWAFRKVSRPVASWKYGVVSVVALLHDTIVPIGAFAYLGHYQGVEVDISFIAAILTILGYSINDTIVVFDRTRENLMKHNIKDFEQVVNKSVNQTLIRSFNTTLTVIIVLFSLYIFGAESLKYFALAMIIGVTIGAYSSVFIASPLLVEWQKRSTKS